MSDAVYEKPLIDSMDASPGLDDGYTYHPIVVFVVACVIATAVWIHNVVVIVRVTRSADFVPTGPVRTGPRLVVLPAAG